MRSLLLVICATACAHAPRAPVEVDAAPAPVERKNVQLSADVTPPVRQACRSKGPRLAAHDRIHGSILVNYQVGADGKVSGVVVQGDATEGAARAVRRYLESCRYTPATQDGKSVAVQWKGELTFPKP